MARMLEWVEGVSVIVPVKNAAALLPAFLDNMLTCGAMEVILCDLGSSDDTVAIAATRGVSIVRGIGTESQAVSEAVKRARGSAFWFLSVRSFPVENAGIQILSALDQRGVVGGYFYLAPRKWSISCWLRVMVRNLNAHLSHKITLSHGLFIDREAYRHIGGIPEGHHGLPRFYQKLAREGQVVCMSDPMHFTNQKVIGMPNSYFD